MPPHAPTAPDQSLRPTFRRRRKSDYLIQSVAHALDVLEMLAGTPDEKGVSDLAKGLGLHKNNVFRLLATLQTRGFVDQNPETDNYRLGIASMELGRGFLQQTRLLRQARAVLEEIAARVGETSHVGIRRGDQVVYLDGAEPDRMLRVAVRPGLSRPLHASAEGKVLAAFDPSGSAFDPAVWEEKKPARFSAGTCVDPQRLAEQMKEVAARGWAMDREECEEGICGMAAPVRDHQGRVIAALSISGPTVRFDSKRSADEFPRLVQEASVRLSRSLGFRQPDNLA